MVTFKDLPDTSTPLNATNLNSNFSELSTQINDLKSLIIYRDKNATATNVGANTYKTWSINMTKPEGYNVLGYIITGNGYNGQLTQSICHSDDGGCAFTIHNLSDTAVTGVVVSVRAVYIKDLS